MPMVALPAALRRPFSLVAFDWDGTAVPDRQADASAAAGAIDGLLRLDMPVAIITGTNFPNVDAQCASLISGPQKRRLYVCANRGSEVYGFDGQGRAVRLHLRQATEEEERLLTQAAEALQAELRRRGLETEIIYDRLNRRKVDLIPLPEWRDPPKAVIDRLLVATEERLRRSGLAGGIREACELALRLSEEAGLADPRITSDVKHVEIGLTDKSDSIDWCLTHLAIPEGIRPEDTLVGGDEFGQIAGLPGSDSLMRTALAAGATFVSVGREPNGVPEGVIHLGGGPERFRRLLADQRRLHLARCDEPPDHAWMISERGFELEREAEVESRFTIGNGYLGARGSVEEGCPASRPATLVAGVYELPPGPRAVPELFPAPNWLSLQPSIEGEPLTLTRGTILAHERALDLRRGLLRREWRHRDAAGRTTRLRSLRFASLADRHLVAHRLELTPEDYSGRVKLTARLDRSALHSCIALGAADADFGELSRAGEAREHELVVTARARGTGARLALAQRSTLRNGKELMEATHEIKEGRGGCEERWEWDALPGQTYVLDRVVVFYSSRDGPNPAEAASRHLAALRQQDWETLLAAQAEAWRKRWELADVQIDGDEDAQRAVRFAAYHLAIAANPEDERVSIGARALSGAGYHGHVFWDTEIYMLPYLIYTQPAAARSLLMYRYHTLAAARRKARERGYQGALYAWESADSGEETTPREGIAADGRRVPIRSGEQEHHISADVPYALWHYWRATGDDDFLSGAGAEILFECARFWASRVTADDEGRYHIRGVIGPDEYHEGVDDNAYTNGMARWTLERAVEAADWLASRHSEPFRTLARRLRLSSAELRRWQGVARRLVTLFQPANRLIEQFSGYFQLDDVDLADGSPRPILSATLPDDGRLPRTQLVKQADVLMLMYLLSDSFDDEVQRENFRYYAPRTMHGSSLSPPIHAALAARLDELDLARDYLRRAIAVDSDDEMGNVAGGIHAALQGGLWQAVVSGFAGLRANGQGVRVDPHLPPEWRRLAFRILWRGRRLHFLVTSQPREVLVTLEAGRETSVRVASGPPLPLTPNQPLRVAYPGGHPALPPSSRQPAEVATFVRR